MEHKGLIHLQLNRLLVENASIDQYYQVANAHCSQTNFDQALAIYQQAVEKFPDCAEVYREMGVIQEKLEDYEGEIESYQKALSLDENQPFWLYATLAHLLGQRDKRSAAIDLYHKGFERHPNDVDGISYARLAHFLSQEGKPEAAITAYRKGLELQPDLLWIKDCLETLNYNQGIKLLFAGQFAAAETYFQTVQHVKVSQETPIWFEQENLVWPWSTFDWIKALESLKPENSNWPRISIVTPSFNQGQFIEETILSVLNQGYPNLEYIVVDGGSTDSTPSIIDHYRKKITITLSEPDSGQSNAINKGFRLATGELFTWLNSDDMLAPGALHRIALEYIKSQCDVIAGMCIAHHNSVIEMLRKTKLKQDDFTPEHLVNLKRWKSGDFFFQPEVMFSREIWEQCGGTLNENLYYSMDHELWFRFSQKQASLRVINWPVALFHKHKKQKTNNKEESENELIKLVNGLSKRSNLEEKISVFLSGLKYSNNFDVDEMKSQMGMQSFTEYTELIEKFFEQENWDEMLKVSTEAVVTFPNHSEGHRWLGIVQEKVEDFRGQLASYQRAVALEEFQPDWLYLVIAQLLIKQDEWEVAVEYLQKTLTLYPQSSEAYRWLGLCKEHLGDVQGQISSYEKSIELSSEQPKWVYEALADARKEQKSVGITFNHKFEPKFQLETIQADYNSNEPITLSNMLPSDASIILFMPYYKANSPARQQEFVYCLERNIKCNFIEKIYLLIDDNHVPEIKDDKVEVIYFQNRPTYLNWVELTREHCQDCISILANTDIYFDESVSLLRTIFSRDEKVFVALSRYEKDGNKQKLHENPHWSQDVWAISGNYKLSESFMKTIDISLGIPRCDNKIAYLFAIHGCNIYNPCHQIKTVHVHETQLRNYSKKGDTSILGGTAWVYPSSTLEDASKFQIDIWTLNAAAISGVQANDSLIRWRKETRKAKPIIGFDAEWQFPAITEKHAYVMLQQKLSPDQGQDRVVYFGFPWATLIDKLLQAEADKEEANQLLEKLLSFKKALQQYGQVITVCQHIRMLECEHLFHEVGITDIFWTHVVKDQKSLPSHPNTLLHPLPLYPVQAVNAKTSNVEREYLFSFIGTRSPKNYLTDSRNKIIDYLSDDERGLIIARDKWHYNKIVYDHQILKTEQSTTELVDQSASDQFTDVMQKSVFALCPSGSGPNSIRLWEAIGLGAIPVILADTYLPPGNLATWYEAAVICPETLDDIKALPGRLAMLAENDSIIQGKRRALKQLWETYGPGNFVNDVVALFRKYESGDIPTPVPMPDVISDKPLISLFEKQIDKKSFKPSYTWPNPKFPFRLYYDGPKCRIFIIENVQHNWDWMVECHEHFRETDFFFVTAGWYQSPAFSNEAETIFSVLNLNKENFFFLYNSPLEMDNFKKKGFLGDVINQNAWLDDSLPMYPMEIERKYDAIYVDFEKKYKRLTLTSKLKNLALVARWGYAKSTTTLTQPAYLNEKALSIDELCQRLNQSHCGLVLSDEEGACPSISDYFLCGIPVVSTPSKGGRDVWFNDENSVICEPTDEAVRAAVSELIQNPRDSQKIRESYIDQVQKHRLKFIEATNTFFKRVGETDVDPSGHFENSFFHKMKKNEPIDYVKSLFD